jgi:UDP-MurNAc hydroxylase
MNVTSLGHAGLKVEAADATVLIDPWFCPEGAFLASWFQYPANQHLLKPSLLEPTAILISHEHLDHLDPWFLAQVSDQIPILIPRYPSPILRQKIAATGAKTIIEVLPWQVVELTPELWCFFVPEESPMNHDAAIVIGTNGIGAKDQTLLNLNDARLSPSQLRSIRAKVGGTIDLLTLQGAGASWYPICYDYPPEQRQALSHRKRMAKFNYMARIINILEPTTVMPFAGPPCFLDPELAPFNTEMEAGIFPDLAQVSDWLLAQGFKNTVILLPGDSWQLTTQTKQPDPHWTDFCFRDRPTYLQQYAQQRADQIAAVIERYPQPQTYLWPSFQRYFQHLLTLSPYFNQKINLRVGFDIRGAGGGQWAVDFRSDTPGVFEQFSDCQYHYQFDARWLPPLLSGTLPWEDFFLSLRFRASRCPDVYNDHLLGLLKFAHAEALQAVETYENTMVSAEQMVIHLDGQNYQVQRRCPHAGVDLLEAGEVLPGGILRCLGHHYEFDLNTGKCLNGNCPALVVQPIGSV